MRTGRNTPFGHSLRASFMLIAECTPNCRASYDAVATTPRPVSPPTMTGIPRRAGLSRCSIDA